jgi:hypothetical protein
MFRPIGRRMTGDVCRANVRLQEIKGRPNRHLAIEWHRSKRCHSIDQMTAADAEVYFLGCSQLFGA